jgi:hypothetical protein
MMKRIAISMFTLMVGSVLSAQITPQAAQAIQSQAHSAVQTSNPAPAGHQANPAPAAVKPSPVAAKAATAAAKPSPAVKAQTPVSVAAKPAAQKTNTAVPAAVAVKPVAAAAKPVVPKTASTKVAPPKPAVQKARNTTEGPKVKEAMVKTETPVAEPKSVINLTGRRDPFTSPVMRALAINQGPGCSSGKRCLAVDQITLRGIVRSPSGMIAVVENSAKRAYFLRENDPVWHGVVEKINGDSVVFREDTVDAKSGKSSSHQIVKRVNAPVV